MTFSGPEEKSPRFVYLIIVLPFLLFYWMFPFVANLSIGQDYQTVSIQYQMELLFSLKTGSFPLYVPGFALGHSSSALTLGQMYHPLPHIASFMPGYWEGAALQWNTFFRLLSLGCTHLMLFFFLRRLKVDLFYSFLISCITVYNLRMLDLFRYGAGLEAYTGHLLLCTALGWHSVRRTKVVGPITIIAATYLLVCSGHPQMMYYGLLGAGLFAVAVPFFVSDILHNGKVCLKELLLYWCEAGLYIVLGIMLSSAYVLPFYFEFIADNAERVGQGYAWADTYGDTFVGTLNSFFLPFRSDVHGNFGGSSLLVVALLTPLLRLFNVKVPKSVWMVYGLVLIIFLHMQGGRTPVHRLVWEYLPFASSFRVAGRATMMMPVFIMMLLCWLARQRPVEVSLRGKQYRLEAFSLIAAAGVIVTVLYYLCIALSLALHSSVMTDFAHFTPVTIRAVPKAAEIAVIVSGIVMLLVMFYYGLRKQTSAVVVILICAVTLFQVGTVMKYGTWIKERVNKPTFGEMKEQKAQKLDYLFSPGSGMYSSGVLTQLQHSFFEPSLGKVYNEITPVLTLNDVYDAMAVKRLPDQLFLAGYEKEYNAKVNADAVPDEPSSVELVYSSFNMLQFRAFSPVPAFFGFSYPYTGRWEARVNGSSVHTYRANGLAHAVEIPGGTSTVEFRYRSPSTLWGMSISIIVFIAAGIYFSMRLQAPAKRIIATAIVLAAGAGFYMLWYHSLYSGDNLNTQYHWKESVAQGLPNLAYGKKTWVSRPLSGGYVHYHSSRAVDGQRSKGSGFYTGRIENPAWTVDLHNRELIESILLYESTDRRSEDECALTVDFSDNGERWHSVAAVTPKTGHDRPVGITLQRPEFARHIRIHALGSCNLRIDEVEIYGPTH